MYKSTTVHVARRREGQGGVLNIYMKFGLGKTPRWKLGATAEGHPVHFSKLNMTLLFFLCVCVFLCDIKNRNQCVWAAVGARYINVESITNVTVIFPHPPSSRRRKECESWSAPLGSDSGSVGGMGRRLQRASWDSSQRIKEDAGSHL